MNRVLIYLTVILLLIGCAGKKELFKANQDGINSDDHAEYYLTFTEATKHALLGNYQNAVALYNLCIKKFPQRSGSYYQLSNIYFSFNEIEKAKNFGRKAIELDKNNEWYLLHLSNIYQYEKNVDSLIILYESIIKLSDKPEYKYNLSVFYSQKGDYNSSNKIVKELENEIPDTREILRIKHMNYSKLHMSDSAIVQLEKLIKLFPSDIDNYGLLAEYLSEINRYSYAGKIYKDLLSFEPDNGLANFSYGDFFLKQGKKDSALIYYKKGFKSTQIKLEDKLSIVFNFLYDPIAIMKDSTFIEDLLNILKQNYSEDERPYTLSAEYYIKRKLYREALIDLEKAISLDINTYIVWEQYIMISSLIKEYSRVIDVYRTALNKFPEKENLYIYSGYALYELKFYDELIFICDKGLKVDDISVEGKIQLLNLKADSYRIQKEYKKSDKLFEDILSFDPENLIIRNNYAYYLALRNENIQYAKDLSILTIQKEPNNPTFLDTYAWILYLAGDYKNALKYIERAIKNGGNKNIEVLDHYALILIKNKRCDDAIDAWKYAIKYQPDVKVINEKKIEDAKVICE